MLMVESKVYLALLYQPVLVEPSFILGPHSHYVESIQIAGS
jgi:hypothetical protein